MVNPLQRLQLAEQQLKKLEALETESNGSNEISTINSINSNVQSFSTGGEELERLEEITGTNDFQSFVLVPDVIPKRWCPEVVPKVNTDADVTTVVFNIFSDPSEPEGLLVVNGGTP